MSDERLEHSADAHSAAAAGDAHHARTQGLKVRPDCSYAEAYMRRHPDTLDLLHD